MFGHRCVSFAFLLASVASLTLASAPAEASCEGSWGRDSFGLYGGLSPHDNPPYRVIETLFNLRTPLRVKPTGRSCLSLDLQASAGVVWIDRGAEFIGGVGPRIRLSHVGLDFWLEAGVRPIFVTGHHFDDYYLGGPFQITTHGAIGFAVGGVRLGVRAQHTSNAGVYSQNDGIDLLGAQIELTF